MTLGDRIKRIRNICGMTQKELGVAIGFDAKNADVRIAQYECNFRTPKVNLRRSIAEVLNVSCRAIHESAIYSAEDAMHMLFELDECYGLQLYEVADEADPSKIHIGISFNAGILDNFLSEWQLRKEALAEGKISSDEYTEWMMKK